MTDDVGLGATELLRIGSGWKIEAVNMSYKAVPGRRRVNFTLLESILLICRLFISVISSMGPGRCG